MAEADFIRQQKAFAAHIRDPAGAPRPTDVEERRMKIYTDLFYNNVEGFLHDAFPVLRRISDDRSWHALVRDFFHYHQSHTPLFAEIPREFLMYLEHERGERPADPTFLWELAHYEWTELALSIAEDHLPPAALDPEGDLLEGHPLLSTLAWPLAYRFPVHRIGPDYQPDTPPDAPTHLLVYRDMKDAVGFLELNPVSARLAGLLLEHPDWSGRHALVHISEELQHPNADTVIHGGLEILREWRQRDIVAGSTPARQQN